MAYGVNTNDIPFFFWIMILLQNYSPLFVVSFPIFFAFIYFQRHYVAYATWCAGGIVVTSVISSVVFKQKLNMIGLVGIVLIVTGCIILNLFGSSNQ